MQPAQIATVEDLVQVLDRHPQWLEALRGRLLTRELLEMPQKLAEFAAAAERRFAAVEGRLDTLERRLELVERRLEALERRLELVERRLEALERRVEALERQMQQIRIDIAPLKAAHARTAALREADLMAEEQGLEFVRTLDQEEIRDLVRSSDTDGISRHEMRSFRLADIMLCATDAAGEECYLAVEVSYTANGRDTTRAQRNARFLTRFTGRRAYAVVASLRLDERIRRDVESGAVAWYRLSPEVLEID